MTKAWFIVPLLLLLSAGTASANPGIVVTVSPVVDTVAPGGTATYTVTVESITTVEEHVVLSISDPTTGWVYTFNPVEFDIAPGATVVSDLSMTVPGDAPQGDYYHTVNASAYLPGLEWLGAVEASTYTNILTTVIPEFPTVAIPAMLALSGYLLIGRRRRE